ncbi:polysaccharide biosynthesis C-terminal domain-containing protein [Luteimonas mephitis]|uniref:oligosaccharide flippase family protein n=1 Tax=Luteimonas mephitis TaxID=83615 RepID=UPI00047C10A3|nr:polysaccharide biosynthesis C-terminal domain-containing protein [Luteimonas mephitis]
MSMRSKTLRNTLFSSVGLYTEYVLGMLTAIVIARHLGPDHYGVYSLAIWLVAVGVAFTNSGTAGGAIKFVAELRGAEREDLIPCLLRYLRHAQRLFLLIVLVAGALLFVFAGDKLMPGLNHWMLLGFLVVAVATRASYMFNIGVAKGFENFRATAIVAMIATPLNLAMVLAVMWLDGSITWLLAVFVVSGLVFYETSRRQIGSLVPATVPGAAMGSGLIARVNRHMKFTACIVTVGFFAASEVEVLFLNLYAEPAAAGQFKVAYQLATGAALLVPGVFAALLLPMMANALSRGHEVAGRRFVASTFYLTFLAAPLVAFGIVFSDSVIGVLYGPAYAAAGPVFAVCLAMAALVTTTQGASSLLISADHQGQILVVSLVCGVLKVVLDAVLISRHGLDGAVVAFALVAVIGAIAVVWLAIRTSGVAPHWWRLLRIWAAALLAGLLALPLRDHMPAIAQIIAGTLVVSLVYGMLTVLFGCWSRDDIGYVQQIHQRLAGSRPRLGAKLLAWAHARARPEPT